MTPDILARLSHRLRRRWNTPRIRVHPIAGLIRLGSRYGGWTLQPSPDLHGATIISAGLGEDASFDVALASRFGARVILVDPTPRALSHFEALRARFGQPATRPYSMDGIQPVESYDLRALTDASLTLESAALWKQDTRVKFFAPPNPHHVSHSIVNYQNAYSTETAHIEVDAVTPETLLRKHGLENVPLMKMDIEGAEITVVEHMIRTNIRPRQLLIEFDELSLASTTARHKVEVADRMLRDSGYVCRHFDGAANFLYLLTEVSSQPRLVVR